MTRVKVIFCWLSLLATSQAMSQHSECNFMKQVIQSRHDFKICVCSNTVYIKCHLNGANVTSKELSTDEERCYKKLVESTNTRNKKTCVCSKLEECHSQEQLAHYKAACAGEAVKSITQILSYFKTLCCDLQNALLKLWLRLEEKTLLRLVKSISYGSLDADTVSAKLRRTEWCKTSHAECLKIDAVLRKGCTAKTRHQGRQKRYIEQPTENYETDIAASSTVTTKTIQEDIRQTSIVSEEMAEKSSAQTRISKPFSTRTTMTRSTVKTFTEKNERQMLSLSVSWPTPSSSLSLSSSSSSSSSSSPQRKAGPSLLSSSLISTSYFPRTPRHLSGLSSAERLASIRNQGNSERPETTLVSGIAVTTFPDDQVATRVMLARLTSSTASSPSSPESTSTVKSASLLLEGSPSRSFPSSGTSTSSSLATPRHSFLGHTMMNEPSKARSMSLKEPIAETVSAAILNTKPSLTQYLIEERDDMTPTKENVTGTRFVKYSGTSISETNVLKTSSVDINRLFDSSDVENLTPTMNSDFHRSKILVSTYEVDATPIFQSQISDYRMKSSISIFTESSSISGSKATYEAHVDPTYNSRTTIDERKTLAIRPSESATTLRSSMVLTTLPCSSVTDESSVVTDKRISNVSFPSTQVFHKERGDLSVSVTDFSVTMAKQTHKQLSVNISQRSNIVIKPTSQTTLTSRSSSLLSPTSGLQMETTMSSFVTVTKHIARNGPYPATEMSVSKLVLRPSSSSIAPPPPSSLSSSLAPSKVSSPSPSTSLSSSSSSSSLSSLSPSSLSSLAPSKVSSPSPSTSLSSSSSSPSLSLSPSLSSLSSLPPSKVTSPLLSASLSALLISKFDASSLSMLIPSTSIQLSKSTAIPLSLLPPSSSSLVSSTSPLPTHPSPTETLPSPSPLSSLTSSPPQKLFFTRQLSLSTSLNSSIFQLEPATRKTKLPATNLSSTLPLFLLYQNSTEVTSNETSSKLLTMSTATTSMIEMKPYSLTDTIRNDFSSLITSVIYSSMARNQTPSLEQKYRVVSFSFSSISSFIQTVSTKSPVLLPASSLSSSETDQLPSISMSSTITTKASTLPFLPAALTTLVLKPSSSSTPSISVPSAMMTTSLSLNPSISSSFLSSPSTLLSNFTASSSMTSTKPSSLIPLFSSSLMPYSTSSLTPSLSILLSLTSSSSSLQSSLSLTPISSSLISSPPSLPSPLSSSWIPSRLSSSRSSSVLFPLTSSSLQPPSSSISLASSSLMSSALLLSLPSTPDLSSLASSSFSSLTSSSMSSLTSSMSSPPLLTSPLMSSSLLLPSTSSSLMPSSILVTTVKQQLSENYTAVKPVMPSRILPIQQSSSPLLSGASTSSLMPSSTLVTTVKQQLSENYTAVKTVMPSRILPIQQSSSPLPSGEPLLKKTFLVVFDGNCLPVTLMENFKVEFVATVTNLTGIDSQLIEVLDVKCGSIKVVFSVLHNQASKIDEIFERLVNRGRFKVVFEGETYQAFNITSIQSTTALPTSSHSSPTIVLSAKLNERRLIKILFVLFSSTFGALTMFGLVICIARVCGRRKSTKIRLKTGSSLSSRGTNQIYKNELELIRLSPLHRHADYYGGTPNSPPREDSDDEDNINNRTALLNMLRNGEIASRRGKITIKDDDSYSSIAFY